MTYDLVTALIAFAFATSITPGPNNLMLMASGANFGFRRTVPHMLGISVGFAILASSVGLGLAPLFRTYPIVLTGLKVGCVIFMAYIAWKIATTTRMGEVSDKAKPMTFLQAAAFQWVNPKAWAMALTAVSVYAPSQTTFGILAVAVVFSCVNLPSVSSWTLIGLQLRRVLSNPARLRVFNITMALLLLASLWPVIGM